jgi:hypothetical protein
MKAAIIVALFAGLACGCAGQSRFNDNLVSPDRIELYYGVADASTGKVRILEDKLTTPGEMQPFLFSGELESKAPCLCDHIDAIVYWKDNRSVHVAVCDRCFDVKDGSGWRYFSMPTEIYVSFYEHKRRSLDRASRPGTGPRPVR